MHPHDPCDNRQTQATTPFVSLPASWIGAIKALKDMRQILWGNT